MDVFYVFAVIVLIEKSCSQVLSHSPGCFLVGETLTLNCKTTNFNQNIFFNFNGGNRGGCIPLSGCGSNIQQSGTTTSLTIQNFNDTLHSGNWTCTYASLPSPVLLIAESPCAEVSDGGLSDEEIGGIIAGVCAAAGTGGAAGTAIYLKNKKKIGSGEGDIGLSHEQTNASASDIQHTSQNIERNEQRASYQLVDES